MNSNSTILVLAGVGLALVLALLLLGGAETPTEEAMAPPETVLVDPPAHVVHGPLTVDVGRDLEVGEREVVQLLGSVSGQTAGILHYRWTAEGGLGFFSDPVARDPSYTAPSACDCEECVVITLTVTDAQGMTASDSLVLTVRDPLNCPTDPCPVAPVCVVEDPCDPPADPVCPPTPEVPCETPCITEVPLAEPCGDIVGPCPCVDGDCASTWMPAWPFEPVVGHPSDRPKPQIIRHFPSHISEGGSFALSAIINNPACVTGCFVWVASKGILEGADTMSPIYHAPMTDRPRGESVTISLILYDAFGGRSYDQIRVAIDNLDYDGPPVP